MKFPFVQGHYKTYIGQPSDDLEEVLNPLKVIRVDKFQQNLVNGE